MGIDREGRWACEKHARGGEAVLEDRLRKAEEARGVGHFGRRRERSYRGGGLHATKKCTPVSRRTLQGVHEAAAP